MPASTQQPDHFRSDLETMAKMFFRFGDVECRIIPSPLYRAFSFAIADDQEMLQLAAARREGQPPPNILYAAAHYLLLEGVDHELREFYPALANNPRPAGDAYPAFRDFCFANEVRIRELMATRTVQTNVVRRSAVLLPAFALAAVLSNGLPLGQIEVGASAGLNLLWHRYHFDYGDGLTWGDPASPVRLEIERRGDVPLPDVPANLRPVWTRGVDLHPVSVTDDDSVRWLQALVWPENTLLAEQLAAAIEIAKGDPPQVLEADASDALPSLLGEAPETSTLCVFGTHTLYQFPHDSLRTLLKSMQTHSETRPVYFVSMEGSGDEHSILRLTVYRDGERTMTDLANCHPHGYWIEWLAKRPIY